MKSKSLAAAACIAAVYVCLSLLLSPFSYGIVQVRVSEAMSVLCLFTPSAVWGLGIGCFFANLLGPNGIADVIVGTAATFAASFLAYRFRKNKYLSMFFPVAINGIAVGLSLKYIYDVELPAILCILAVAAGEAVSVFCIGLPFAKLLEKRKGEFDL